MSFRQAGIAAAIVVAASFFFDFPALPTGAGRFVGYYGSAFAPTLYFMYANEVESKHAQEPLSFLIETSGHACLVVWPAIIIDLVFRGL